MIVIGGVVLGTVGAGGWSGPWWALVLSAFPVVYQPVVFWLVRSGSSALRRAALSVAMLGFAAAMLWLGHCDDWWTRGTCLVSEGSSRLTHGLFWGFLLAALVACVLAIVAGVPRWREKLRDERVRELRPWEVWVSAVLIVLGTALPEEVIFRGVLFTAWRDALGLPAAVIASSGAFGLWHIAPERERVRAKRDRPAARGGIAGGIAFTAAAGVVFALLRHWTEAIWPGVVLHASVNICSLVASRSASNRS